MIVRPSADEEAAGPEWAIIIALSLAIIVVLLWRT